MIQEKAQGILPYPQVLGTHISPSVFFILDNLGLEYVNRDTKLQDLPQIVTPDQKINGWGLPGHGESKDTCGNFYRKVCLNTWEHPEGKAVFKNLVHSCHSYKCPICWHSWTLRAAKRVTDRIRATQEQKPWLGLPIHVAASVPPELYHLSFQEMKKILYPMLKKIGFMGGSCILHIYRQVKNSGLWYFSPHFHLIGFGWLKGIAENYEESGWVIKHLGVRKNVFGTAFYQLTHAAVWYGEGRRQTVTYVGESNNRNLKLPKYEQPAVGCPYCGAKMQRAIRLPGFPDPLPCNGIDGFYLADADGWTDASIQREIAFIPADMLLPRFSPVAANSLENFV